MSDPRITWPIFLWQTCAWSGGVYGGTGHLYQAICAPVSPSLPGCDTNFRMKPDPGGTDDMPTAEEMWNYRPGGKSTVAELLIAANNRADAAANYSSVTRTDVAAIKAATDTVEPKLAALGSALANLDVAALTAKLTTAVQDALAAGIPPDVLTQSLSDALGDGGLHVELSGTAKPGTSA